MDEFEAHKSAIAFIGIGMLAGLVSQLVLPGRGFGMLATIGLGIAGMFLGKMFVAQRLTFIEDDLFRVIAAAIVCTMVISVIINLIRGGEDKDLTHWRDR